MPHASCSDSCCALGRLALTSSTMLHGTRTKKCSRWQCPLMSTPTRQRARSNSAMCSGLPMRAPVGTPPSSRCARTDGSICPRRATAWRCSTTRNTDTMCTAAHCGSPCCEPPTSPIPTPTAAITGSPIRCCHTLAIVCNRQWLPRLLASISRSWLSPRPTLRQLAQPAQWRHRIRP